MNTVNIRPLPGERRVNYSAGWFVPVDEVTGMPPALPLRVFLDIHDGQGWVPTGIEPAITLSGAITYPGLGRCHNPAAAAPTRYRARFESEAYLAVGRAHQDGEEFLPVRRHHAASGRRLPGHSQPRPGRRLPVPRPLAGALRTGQHGRRRARP